MLKLHPNLFDADECLCETDFATTTAKFAHKTRSKSKRLIFGNILVPLPISTKMFTTRSVAIFIFKCIMVYPKADINNFIHDYGISKMLVELGNHASFYFSTGYKHLFFITDIIQRSKKDGGHRFYQNALQSTIV